MWKLLHSGILRDEERCRYFEVAFTLCGGGPSASKIRGFLGSGLLGRPNTGLSEWNNPKGVADLHY